MGGYVHTFETTNTATTLVHDSLRQERNIVQRSRFISIRLSNDLQHIALPDRHAAEVDTHSRMTIQVDRRRMTKDILTITIPLTDLMTIQVDFPVRFTPVEIIVIDSKIVGPGGEVNLSGSYTHGIIGSSDDSDGTGCCLEWTDSVGLIAIEFHVLSLNAPWMMTNALGNIWNS